MAIWLCEREVVEEGTMISGLVLIAQPAVVGGVHVFGGGCTLDAGRNGGRRGDASGAAGRVCKV